MLVYLVANFADMADQRQVSTEEALDLCKELGFHNYMEVSAFTGVNIEELFETLTKHLFLNHEKNLEKYVSWIPYDQNWKGTNLVYHQFLYDKKQ